MKTKRPTKARLLQLIDQAIREAKAEPRPGVVWAWCVLQQLREEVEAL